MLPSASPLSSPRSPFSPSQRPEEEIAFFGRHNLRKIHGCAPEEYTPPKEYSMPKAEIPIEVAPSGAWPALDDDSWPPKGKCPCVPGDGSLRDLAGVGSVKRQRLQFEESPAAVVGGPNCDSDAELIDKMLAADPGPQPATGCSQSTTDYPNSPDGPLRRTPSSPLYTPTPPRTGCGAAAAPPRRHTSPPRPPVLAPYLAGVVLSPSDVWGM